MSDQDSFLKAICDDPCDDAPRLVFADWLDEHGENGIAEFIRFQCYDHKHAIHQVFDIRLSKWRIISRTKPIPRRFGRAIKTVSATLEPEYGSLREQLEIVIRRGFVDWAKIPTSHFASIGHDKFLFTYKNPIRTIVLSERPECVWRQKGSTVVVGSHTYVLRSNPPKHDGLMDLDKYSLEFFKSELPGIDFVSGW